MGGGSCADGCGRPIATIRPNGKLPREIPYCIGHAAWRSRASSKPKTVGELAELFGVSVWYVHKQLQAVADTRPGGLPW